MSELITSEFLKRLDAKANQRLNEFRLEMNKAMRDVAFKYGIQEVVFESYIRLPSHTGGLVFEDREKFEEKALKILKENEMQEFEQTLKNLSWALQGQY